MKKDSLDKKDLTSFTDFREITPQLNGFLQFQTRCQTRRLFAFENNINLFKQ